MAASTLGFEQMAALKASQTPAEYREFHAGFLRRGLAADLEYLHRPERFDLRYVLPDARTLLLFLYPYRFHTVEEKLRAVPYKVARYAWQRDYHDMLKEKLGKLLADFHLDGRAVTDSAPVAERYWARRAGLGKIGRNGMLINPQSGSYFLIASLVLADRLEADQYEAIPSETTPVDDIAEVCAECNLCVEACPTGALFGDALMDVSRCVSYQTIESRAVMAEPAEHGRRHRWIFGCDICQQVCPHNKAVFADDRFSAETPLALAIASGDVPETRAALKGTAFHRRGPQKLRENIAAVTKTEN